MTECLTFLMSMQRLPSKLNDERLPSKLFFKYEKEYDIHFLQDKTVAYLLNFIYLQLKRIFRTFSLLLFL